MLHENEIAMAVLGIGVLLFIVANRLQISRIPHYRILLAAYILYLGAWFLTVAEGYWMPAALNILEHVCYALGALFALSWIVATARPGREG